MPWLDTNLQNPQLRPLAQRLVSELRLGDEHADAVEMLLTNLQQAGQEPLLFRRAADAYSPSRYQRFDRHHILSPLWRMRGKYIGESKASAGHAPTAQALPLLQSRLARIEATAVFAEPIILRAEKLWNEKRAARVAAGIDYEDTDETNRMRDELRLYNDFMAQHRVVDATGQRHSTHLARIFSQRDFRKGGRFYRASYQQLGKPDRAKLTIDGEAVAELDFASMHPTMLYLRAGLEPPEDAYVKDGFDRGILKRVFNVALNASTPWSACRAVARSLRESGHAEPERTARRYIEAMPELYPEFAGHLFTGVGLDLQRLDSDIAAMVMADCMKGGIAVLVMHDSFLVNRSHHVELPRRMTEAFQQVLGTTHTPKIK